MPDAGTLRPGRGSGPCGRTLQAPAPWLGSRPHQSPMSPPESNAGAADRRAAGRVQERWPGPPFRRFRSPPESNLPAAPTTHAPLPNPPAGPLGGGAGGRTGVIAPGVWAHRRCRTGAGEAVRRRNAAGAGFCVLPPAGPPAAAAAAALRGAGRQSRICRAAAIPNGSGGEPHRAPFRRVAAGWRRRRSGHRGPGRRRRQPWPAVPRSGRHRTVPQRGAGRDPWRRADKRQPHEITSGTSAKIGGGGHSRRTGLAGATTAAASPAAGSGAGANGTRHVAAPAWRRRPVRHPPMSRWSPGRPADRDHDRPDCHAHPDRRAAAGPGPRR